MNIARRTCGYIGLNDWNQGRVQEIKERYATVSFTEVDKLDETERGAGGFGSTGVSV